MHVTTANIDSVIVSEIPDLRPDIEEWEGLEHLMFMELFLWAESSVRGGRTDDMARALRLVDAIFQDCDDKIKNAVTVSFLERIDPEDEVGRRMFDALTPELRKQWHALDEYMQQLIGKSVRGSVARSASQKKA
ncbi:MAG TPA: hypothetical protein VK828_19015 [Terriglobales bacterium]|jgi:hypothetical protein|nr:hypothetical protein [Terriglobales bacterium]